MPTKAEFQALIDAGAVNDQLALHQKLFGAHKVVQTASALQAAAPAGGTGATAGAYDTAPNRDSLIALVNQMRTALINAGYIKGSA